MSKVLDATCLAGVVKVGALPVAGADILSEGVASSSGILVMDEDRKTYIPKTSGDLVTTLEKIADALGDIASALTLLDGKPTGTLPPAPAAASLITSIQATKAEVEALKEALR